MTTTISITRALSEIKFAVCVTKNTNYNINKNEFSSQVTAKNQSLNDLITRRERLKAAIMKSNATTMVKIGSKEMTVVEAIEMKKTIKYKESLLDVLKRQRLQVTKEYEAHKDKVKKAIDANITQICSRDVKPDPSTIQDLTDMMWKNDPVEIYDPLGLDKTIDALTTEIEDFNSNVDFALSESNSLTQIEV
jgi:uncharacterized OsmC-like protein